MCFPFARCGQSPYLQRGSADDDGLFETVAKHYRRDAQSGDTDSCTVTPLYADTEPDRTTRGGGLQADPRRLDIVALDGGNSSSIAGLVELGMAHGASNTFGGQVAAVADDSLVGHVDEYRADDSDNGGGVVEDLHDAGAMLDLSLLLADGRDRSSAISTSLARSTFGLRVRA